MVSTVERQTFRLVLKSRWEKIHGCLEDVELRLWLLWMCSGDYAVLA